MGRIYRATYSYLGVTKTAEAWSVEFQDHTAHRRRLTAFGDRRLSEQLLLQIERVVDCRRASSPLPADLATWIEKVTPDLRTKLAGWGVLDAARIAASQPLLAHLEDWRKSMTLEGLYPRHVYGQYSQAKRLLVACRFVTWTDIQPAKVQEFLSGLNKIPAKKKDKEEATTPKKASARTCNAYLVAFKSFLNWMVEVDRAHHNPIKHLSRMSSAPVRERRALEVADFQKLIRATRNGTWFRMSGPDRAALYLLAAQTGLRWGEIAALTRVSFNLESTPPSVFLPGAMTKNGNDAALPLLPELVALLRPSLSMMLPVSPAFPMPKDRDGAEMMRHDLEAAGLPEKDAAGRVFDFHALRHQFGTMLAQANVNVKTAMELMRHSDVNLTMKLYSHVLMGDAASALSKMAKLDVPEETQKVAACAEISGGIPANEASLPCPISQVRAGEEAGFQHEASCAIKQKAPGNAALSALPGASNSGAPAKTRTWNLLIRSQTPKPDKTYPLSVLREDRDSSVRDSCQTELSSLLRQAARCIESKRYDPELVEALVRASQDLAVVKGTP